MSRTEKTPKSGFRKKSLDPQQLSAFIAPQIDLPPDQPRFLISRLGKIGDSILTMPVACALREHLPGAYIAWAVEEDSVPVLENHPAVDDVVVMNPGWLASPNRLRAARNQLHRLACDVAIDCQGGGASALACFLSGAAHRIGYAGKSVHGISRWISNVHVQPVFKHLTDRSLELLTPLGIHKPTVRWQYPIAAPAQRWASRYRNTFSSNRIALLNPGATWHSKRWLPERFGEVAQYLGREYGYTSIAVWGNGLDHALASDIVLTSGGHAVLAPETDLQHLAALIESSDLLISSDTGPLHMGVAVGTPVIGLYGATRPGDRGPYGQIAIQKAYESGSRRQRRNASNAAMCAITVQDVCRAIEQMNLPAIYQLQAA